MCWQSTNNVFKGTLEANNKGVHRFQNAWERLEPLPLLGHGPRPEAPEAPVVDPFATRSVVFKRPAGRPTKKPAASVAPPPTTQPSTPAQKSPAEQTHRCSEARRLYSGAYHRERKRLKSEGLGDKEVLEGARAAGKQAIAHLKAGKGA
jgi:hypothetical protein